MCRALLLNDLFHTHPLIHSHPLIPTPSHYYPTRFHLASLTHPLCPSMLHPSFIHCSISVFSSSAHLHETILPLLRLSSWSLSISPTRTLYLLRSAFRLTTTSTRISFKRCVRSCGSITLYETFTPVCAGYI